MACDSAGIGQTSIFLAEIHMTSEYLSNELAQALWNERFSLKDLSVSIYFQK